MRLNKIRNLNPSFPEIELVREESNLRQEHDLLKENYWELQEIVTEMKDKESEYQLTIENLKEQLQRSNLPQNTSYGKLYNHIPLTDLSAITPVDDDSFLSSASNSPRKALGALISNEKDAVKELEFKNTLVDQAQKLFNASNTNTTNTTRESTTSFHKPHYSHNSFKKSNEDKKYYKRKR